MSEYKNEIVDEIKFSKYKSLCFILSVKKPNDILSHIRMYVDSKNFKEYKKKNGFCFSIDHLNSLYEITNKISTVDKPKNFGHIKYYNSTNEVLKILSNL